MSKKQSVTTTDDVTIFENFSEIVERGDKHYDAMIRLSELSKKYDFEVDNRGWARDGEVLIQKAPFLINMILVSNGWSISHLLTGDECWAIPDESDDYDVY